MKTRLLLIIIALWLGIGQLAAQAPADDPRLINITTLEQLDAIRHDLDGNGEPTSGGRSAYETAFSLTSGANNTCSSGCQGYELMNDLDFDDVDHVLVGLQLSRWAKHAGDPTMHPLASGISIGGAPSFTGTAVPGGWVPIGDNSNQFTSTFEGNGHTISNLYINTTTITNVGLFGRIEYASVGIGPPVLVGEIRNLGIKDGSVTGTRSSASVGGLVGRNTDGKIIACYATGSATGGTSARVGGLVGHNSAGQISACYTTGSVTGENSASVGGLVGHNSAGQISACYATGSVMGTGNSASVGGLVGYNDNFSHVIACYATGSATGGTSARVGGLVGQNDRGYIRACYAKGSATVGDDADVGGLVGWNNGGTISACYSTGSVTGGDDADVGGLVGVLEAARISVCYATGSVTGGSGTDVGGLVGKSSGTISVSYFDKTTAIFSVGGSAPAEKRGIGNGGVSSTALGKITSDLQSPTAYGTRGSLYENWNVDIDGDGNIDDPWDFGTRRQYPVLQVDFDGDGSPSAYEFGGQDRVDPDPDDGDDGDDGSSRIAITSMSPNSGPVGAEVTLRGRGFSMIPARNRVIFNGVADLSTDDALVRSLTPISATEMTIRVPEGALSGRIRLIVEGERATSSEDFTVRSDGSASDVAVFRVPDLGNGKLGVYPNPANRWIHFKGLSAASRYRYLLYTIAGRGSLSGTLVDQHTIEIASLSAGYYVLVLQDDRLTEVLREAIVIE